MKLLVFLGGIIFLLLIFLVPAAINFNDPEFSVSFIMALLLGISVIAPLIFYFSPAKLSAKSLNIFAIVILLLIIPQQLIIFWSIFGFCWSPGNCTDIAPILLLLPSLLTILPPILLAFKFFKLARQQNNPDNINQDF